MTGEPAAVLLERIRAERASLQSGRREKVIMLVPSLPGMPRPYKPTGWKG